MKKQKEFVILRQKVSSRGGGYDLKAHTEMKDCTECNGEGKVYIDTSRSCTVYRGDCCGGCGHDVECEICNGTGTIKDEDDE
jgi:DnaJ-class molecular chaperone